MGACLTLEREEGKARRRSEEIDKQLGELAKQQSNVIKILLLGIHKAIFEVHKMKYFDCRCGRKWQKYFGQTDEDYSC